MYRRQSFIFISNSNSGLNENKLNYNRLRFLNVLNSFTIKRLIIRRSEMLVIP